MEGTHELQEMRENLPEEIDIFQGNKNRGIRAQIRNAAKALHKARSDSFKKTGPSKAKSNDDGT
eukprot:6480412-Ditylum_brightwellii.AAC.2